MTEAQDLQNRNFRNDMGKRPKGLRINLNVCLSFARLGYLELQQQSPSGLQRHMTQRSTKSVWVAVNTHQHRRTFFLTNHLFQFPSASQREQTVLPSLSQK